MSGRFIAHVLAAALITMSGAAAVAALAVERAPSAAPLTPVQIIRARQASYELSVMTFSQLKRAADTGSDVTKQKFAIGLVTLHVAAIVFYALRGKNLVWPMLSC